MQSASSNVTKAAVALIGAILSLSGASAAETSEFKKLAEGVYVHLVNPDSVYVSNAGVILLKDSVLIYDAHFTPEGGEGLLKKIQDVSKNPVRYAAFSHFHPDHTHGIQAFGSSILLCSSGNSRRDILERDQPSMERALKLAQTQIEQAKKQLDRATEPERKSYLLAQMENRQKVVDTISRIQVRAPVMTVDDSLTILDETRPLELRMLGPGHTDGDMVLFLPREKILFAGDLFFNAALPSVEDAHLLRWIGTLEELLKLPAEVYIAGHGAVGSRKEVEEFLLYLRELRALVEPAVRRGDPLEQVVRESQLPSKYLGCRFQNFFPANVKKMYAELMTEQMAAPPLPPEPSRGRKSPVTEPPPR